MKKRKIKLFEPFIDNNEISALRKALKSKFWASGSGVGKVLEFESKFRKYIGSRECVAVNSGTAALHLALSLFDIRNKEVILPSLSFISTANAVMYNGGKPVFVDIEPKTLCLDPEKVRKSITKNTKMILPVHFGGMPCQLDELSELGQQNEISMVEDAAHGAGATYKDKKIGSHGKAVCFSFHPVKNLAMPTGGAITLNAGNIKVNKKILNSRRWCGISNRRGAKYDVEEIGWNYYMNEFSAVIGIEQLKKLDRMNQRRKRIAKRYSTELSIESKMPFEKDCSYHLYWLCIKNRDEFMKLMLKNGVETGIHFKPIHKMRFYRNNIKLKNTEKASLRIVSLPMHSNLSDDDVSYIINSVNKFAK